ncbi:unnamed protein product [Taenia asiatica]|uniref:Uncharacterized protein n=1 Tax=Taenia asiatica TaxID=60517 RepID=A0A0R3W7J1_TAEAS|nr:unnamed protein product [Taenia asiatica]
MQAPSSLISLLLLIACVSYRVSPSSLPDDDATRRLEADLFDVLNAAEGEEVLEAKEGMEEEEDEIVGEPNEATRQGGVLMPAGWRRLRQSIRRRIRRIFRKPRQICFPYCPKGPKKGRGDF